MWIDGFLDFRLHTRRVSSFLGQHCKVTHHYVAVDCTMLPSVTQLASNDSIFNTVNAVEVRALFLHDAVTALLPAQLSVWIIYLEGKIVAMRCGELEK